MLARVAATYTGAMESDRPLWRSRAWAAAFAVLALGLGALLTVNVSGQESRVGVLTAMGIVFLTVLVVTAARVRVQRARYEQDLADWATERAAQRERLRIAGELHDLVSHGIGLITLRATAARSVSGAGAEGEREDALADIERASRETTAELRRMLTVLREPGAAPLRPAETLADLPGIVRAANASGLRAVLEGEASDREARNGEAPDREAPDGEAPGGEALGEVSPGAQLTVCAIVREALNNAYRHAGPTDVRVSVRREGDAIAVRVADSGPLGAWRPEPGAGRGLDSLRERVASHGGELEAGPHGAGFLVVARIAGAGAA